MSRRAIPYIDAIRWVIDNDDLDFTNAVRDCDLHDLPLPLVTVCLIADIYGRDTNEVMMDIRKVEVVTFFDIGTPIMAKFANEHAVTGIAHHGHPAVSFDICRREIRIIRKVEE
jgi:hypothetical protein